MPLPRIVTGSITDLDVEAIVNAANGTLMGGGGVDGAIHAAAGPGLDEECRKLGGCPPGQVRLTGGYCLRARYIIHTVGPIWQGGKAGEDEVLADCYRNSLALAVQHGITSLAFPAISTGAYGFPKARAAQIAVTTILAAKAPARVLLSAFSPEDAAILQAALAEATRARA